MATTTPADDGFRPAQAERILVIKLDEIGDLVLATPFLRGLRASAPRARISLVVRPAVLPLTAGCPWVDSVVTPAGDLSGGRLDLRGRTPEDLRAFAADFRAGFGLAVTARYDVDLHGAATLAAATRAPVRLAFSETVTPWKGAGNRGFDAAYTHRLPGAAPRHEVEHGLALLAALGGADPEAARGSPVALWPDAVDRAGAAALLDDAFGGSVPERLLVLAPTTAAPRRNLPATRFAAIAAAAAARWPGGGAVLIGDGEGRERAATVAAALSGRPVADLTGRTDLRTAAGIIGRGAVLLGMDSGPAHLAAALGVPAAVISCHPRGGAPDYPSAPERFRPWGNRVLVVRPDRPAPPCTDGCRSAEPHCIAAIDDRAAADAVSAFADGVVT
ncbi:glycosyltransferase family 9 protein [Azospirillum halopraeferens]|uniref:glycosyltransferase family 9 protein n=1 Tax=Azospirillum halopraeferens TaxID=34010 RepID=UPI00041B8B75|nr:glycosyltransferase family 9 protein [Azospirillum halopraeferens]